ncbi:FtsW/RodA/SpoVE family cell cycle protein [Chlamydiia bacterium]|nr:FtsW/RodA/SpoVE family cell cycle protein [Chlamydiia bacterium]
MKPSKPLVDFEKIVLIVVIIYTLSLLFVFNISSADTIELSPLKNQYGMLLKHLLFGFVSVIAFNIVRNLSIRIIDENIETILAVSVFFLLLPFAPIVGVTKNGAARWFNIGGVNVQPSEIIKWIIIVFFTKQIRFIKANGWSTIELCKAFMKIFIPVLLIFLEPDNRTTLFTIIMCAYALFVMKAPRSWFIFSCLLFMTVGITGYYVSPYVQKRIEVFLYPSDDIMGNAYQVTQAKIAIGSGGLMGRGLGSSVQKYAYLPEAQNDFILAIVGEESGFIGLFTLVFLYVTLIYLLFRKATKLSHLPYSEYAIVCSFGMAIQVVINVGVVSGTLPPTGINLPFFSLGGSALISNSLLLGLVLSTWSNEKIPYSFESR